MATKSPLEVSLGLSIAIIRLRQGRPVIVIDDPDREGEGDLVYAAEFVKPSDVAFMTRMAGGLIGVAMSPEYCDAKKLFPMVPLSKEDPYQTGFCVSCDAVTAGSGISATDRAATINLMANPMAGPNAFRRPGHVVGLRGRSGGVAERRGHTESGLELMKLCKLNPAACLCEILRDDGECATQEDLMEFSARHQVPVITVDEIAKYVAGPLGL